MKTVRAYKMLTTSSAMNNDVKVPAFFSVCLWKYFFCSYAFAITLSFTSYTQIFVSLFSIFWSALNSQHAVPFSWLHDYILTLRGLSQFFLFSSSLIFRWWSRLHVSPTHDGYCWIHGKWGHTFMPLFGM